MQLQGKKKLLALVTLRHHIHSKSDLLKCVKISDTFSWSGVDIFEGSDRAKYTVDNIILAEPRLIFPVCDVLVEKDDSDFNHYHVVSNSPIIWSRMLYGKVIPFSLCACSSCLEEIHDRVTGRKSDYPYIMRMSMVGKGSKEVLCNWVFSGESEKFTFMFEGVLDTELSLVERVLCVLNPMFNNRIGELYYVCPGVDYERSDKVMYRVNEKGEYVVILY